MPGNDKITFQLPGGASVDWQPDTAEITAAWELYVELATRIATYPLGNGEGLAREALSSLYSLFPTTRDILRKAGPGVGASRNSVGGMAIGVLNGWLRPFLSEWHPRLLDWESRRPGNLSPVDHEKEWPDKEKLRDELATLRSNLDNYAAVLAQISGTKTH